MELKITTQNLDLLPSLRNHVERKLEKLDRRISGVSTCNVDLAEEKTRAVDERFVAQITLEIGGILLRGEERGETLITAIDKVIPIIDRQIERFKGKRGKRNKGSIPAKEVMSEANAKLPPESEVVKVKRFKVRKMLVVDAIEQMELLGHDFFLFDNADTRELNLLYRRKDGNYSIIEPELGR